MGPAARLSDGAPAYAEKRRGLAHSIGLGRKKATDAVETVKTSAGEALDAARGHLTDDNSPKHKAKRAPKSKAPPAEAAS